MARQRPSPVPVRVDICVIGALQPLTIRTTPSAGGAPSARASRAVSVAVMAANARRFVRLSIVGTVYASSPTANRIFVPIVLSLHIVIVVVTAVVARPVEEAAAHHTARFRSGGPATCTTTSSLTVIAVTYVVRERIVLFLAVSGRAAPTEQRVPLNCLYGRCEPAAMSKEQAARVLPHTPVRSTQHPIPPFLRARERPRALLQRIVERRHALVSWRQSNSDPFPEPHHHCQWR